MGALASMALKMMIKGGARVADQLDEVTKNPKAAQEALLLKLVQNARDTEFGKAHNFADIKTVADYQAAVPLTDYDDYYDDITRMMQGQPNILTAKEVVHFNVTSGTMGAPKKIPVCEDHVSTFAKYNSQYLNYIPAQMFGTDWTRGKGLSLSEGTYTRLPTGVSVGCASSLHTARMEKMVKWMPMDSMDMMYTSPKEARQPSELGVYSRYLHALFALREENITYGNVTFSSVLLELMRYIELHWEMLCSDIEHGTIDASIDMPQTERASVLKRLKPAPERAAQLRSIFQNHIDEPFAHYIWPRLQFFICVGGAGFQTYTDKLLSRYFGADVHILYMGVTSSEGFYSVPLKMDSPDSVLVPDGVFMEFIPVADGVRVETERIKCMWELEQGKQYEMVITNVSGLYRYQLKDVIEVTGFHNATPVVQFVNRAGFAINVCAEKTSEQVLQHTAQATAADLGLSLYDYCVCPHEDNAGVRYIFMYEFTDAPADIAGVTKQRLRDVTERHLIEDNPDYDEELRAQNLKPTEVRVLQQETFMLYRDMMVMKGTAAAQLKPVHVTKNPFQEKFFLGLEDKEIFGE